MLYEFTEESNVNKASQSKLLQDMHSGGSMVEDSLIQLQQALIAGEQ